MWENPHASWRNKKLIRQPCRNQVRECNNNVTIMVLVTVIILQESRMSVVCYWWFAFEFNLDFLKRHVLSNACISIRVTEKGTKWDVFRSHPKSAGSLLSIATRKKNFYFWNLETFSIFGFQSQQFLNKIWSRLFLLLLVLVSLC